MAAKMQPPILFLRYGSALVLVLAATLARMVLHPLIGTQAPFFTFFLAVMVTAWWVGLGPALLSLFLGAVVTGYLFALPGSPFALPQGSYPLALGFFLLTTLTNTALIDFLKRAQRRAETSAAEAVDRQRALEEEIAERERAAALNARLHAQIDRQRQQLDDLVASVPGVVWEGWGQPDSAAQRIDFVSHYVEPLLGYPEAEWLANPNFWLSIVHPDDRERAASEAAAIFASGRSGTSQFRWIARDGRVVSALAHSVSIRDETGAPIGMRGVTLDITAQKQAEEAVRAAQEALRQRAEALQEADRQKDAFLAMLGHELRTPLAAIRNTLLVVERRASGSSGLELQIARLDRMVTRMGRIVDDLQDVSRITQGRLSLHREPLDLRHLVRQTAEDQRELLQESGQTLTLDLPEQPVWVEGDPIRLAQVLVNLLHNAGKFSDPGGQVRVRLGENEDELTVAVQDDGIGIDPEMLPRVFDSFTQAERSLDRSRGGLGLGLALVKGLVALHGGTVAATSAGRGRGSEFTFRLPRAHQETEKGERLPAEQGAAPRSAGGVLPGREEEY
jgi:PAS domain S-box-containing protein